MEESLTAARVLWASREGLDHEAGIAGQVTQDPNAERVTWCRDVAAIIDAHFEPLQTELAALRAERDRLRVALEFTKGHLDHLMDVWGQEGVTRTIRDKITAALEPRP